MVHCNEYCLGCMHSAFYGPDVTCMQGYCEPEYEDDKEQEDEICV